MTMESRRVLIAEDNPGLAHVLRFNLESAGLDVTVAETGSDAWEIAQENEFDAVITDHEMPGMTGVELCRHLRQSELHCKTPILMVTAREMEMDSKNLREELKLAGIFSKPYSPGEVLQTLENMMNTTV